MAGKFCFLVLGIHVLFSCVLAVKPRISCSSTKPSQDVDATTAGEIVSPGFPGPYSSNQNCTWKLKAPLASVVRVTITNLNLDQTDSLTISDGETAFGGNLFGKYSRCMAGSLSLFSTGQYMLVQFKSDGSGSDKGFKIEYKVVRQRQIVTAGRVNTLCSFNVVMSKSSGYFAHPGFPGPITKFKTCYWEVRYGNSNKSPHLSYKMLGLKTDPGVCYDSQVQFNLGGKVGKFCGCDGLPKNMRSNANNAFVLFKAFPGSDTGHPGFLIYYKEMGKATCPGPTKCPALEDDRNVGFDRDANILYERNIVTTKPAPTSPAPKST